MEHWTSEPSTSVQTQPIPSPRYTENPSNSTILESEGAVISTKPAGSILSSMTDNNILAVPLDIPPVSMEDQGKLFTIMGINELPDEHKWGIHALKLLGPCIMKGHIVVVYDEFFVDGKPWYNVCTFTTKTVDGLESKCLIPVFPFDNRDFSPEDTHEIQYKLDNEDSGWTGESLEKYGTKLKERTYLRQDNTFSVPKCVTRKTKGEDGDCLRLSGDSCKLWTDFLQQEGIVKNSWGKPHWKVQPTVPPKKAKKNSSKGRGRHHGSGSGRYQPYPTRPFIRPESRRDSYRPRGGIGSNRGYRAQINHRWTNNNPPRGIDRYVPPPVLNRNDNRTYDHMGDDSMDYERMDQSHDCDRSRFRVNDRPAFQAPYQSRNSGNFQTRGQNYTAVPRVQDAWRTDQSVKDDRRNYDGMGQSNTWYRTQNGVNDQVAYRDRYQNSNPGTQNGGQNHNAYQAVQDHTWRGDQSSEYSRNSAYQVHRVYHNNGWRGTQNAGNTYAAQRNDRDFEPRNSSWYQH